MNIVFATSEMVPFAKTGGLADVCGSLPPALAKKGQKVKVFLPKYKMVDTKRFPLETVLDLISVVIGEETVTGKVYGYDYQEGVQVLFVENNELYDRDNLYGTPQGDYPDNRRFQGSRDGRC